MFHWSAAAAVYVLRLVLYCKVTVLAFSHCGKFLTKQIYKKGGLTSLFPWLRGCMAVTPAGRQRHHGGRMRQGRCSHRAAGREKGLRGRRQLHDSGSPHLPADPCREVIRGSAISQANIRSSQAPGQAAPNPIKGSREVNSHEDENDGEGGCNGR